MLRPTTTAACRRIKSLLAGLRFHTGGARRCCSIYLHHPQTWHRGTQNVSGKRRYLHQQQYGQAWFFGRFFTDVHQPGYDTPLDFADSGDEPDGLDDEKVAQVLGLRPASNDRPWGEGVRFD